MSDKIALGLFGNRSRIANRGAVGCMATQNRVAPRRVAVRKPAMLKATRIVIQPEGPRPTMSRPWSLEWRGGLSALALIVMTGIGVGFVPVDDPLVMILNNLRVHGAMVLVGIAIIMLIAHARLRALVFLVIGGTLLVMVVHDLAPMSEMPAAGTTGLKVVAFNVLGTNLENGARISQFLLSVKADVVFVEESRPVLPFQIELAQAYPFQVGCNQQDDSKGACGDVLMLSNRPLENVRILKLDSAGSHQAIIADIMFNGRLVHLFAIHLQRPYHGDAQAREFRKLAEILAKLAGPVILAGDFNAAPWYSAFAGMLRTGGMYRAAFEPGTWPVLLGELGVPIDHILVKAPAHLAELTALSDSFGSNHRGLQATIAFGDGQ